VGHNPLQGKFASKNRVVFNLWTLVAFLLSVEMKEKVVARYIFLAVQVID
jgi:hypothetical protein